MKKTALLSFMVMFAATGLYAQSASELLNKVSKNYQSIAAYYIKFEFHDSNHPETETGDLYASKDKYSVQIMDIRQMYDGKNLYTISKEDKEVTVSQPSPDSNDFLSPTKILNIYKDNFEASMDKTGTANGKKVQYLKLTPKSKTEIDYAIVGIYTDNHTLYNYREYYGVGNSREFTVKEYLENLIIPKALFKFDQSKYEKDGYIVTPI